MAHEARSIDLIGDRRTGAPSRDVVIYGLALRLTIVSAAVCLIGLISLLQGGLAPVVALALVLGGGATSYGTGRYVAKWLQQPDRNSKRWAGCQDPAIALDRPIRAPE